MRQRWQVRVAAAAVIGGLGVSRPATAQLVGVNARGGMTGTTLDWGVLGPTGTPVANGTTLPAGPIHMTVTTANGGGMQRLDQGDPAAGNCVAGPFWYGNFFPCERLLDAFQNGPLTFTFDHLVSAFGLNVQPPYPGTYDATLHLFRGATPLGSYTVEGTSYAAPLGGALFVGELSSGAATDFDRVVLSVFQGGADIGAFAVDAPVLEAAAVVPTPPSTVPEPTGLALLATGLLALGAARGRRHG
jgi:hypothetical protein